jgi:hypothetical protein
MNLFSDQRLADLLARSRTPEFAPARDRLRADVAALREMGLDAPDASAGYYHDFFCPEHAVELAWDPRSPGAHRCPVDGKVFCGEPFDSAWRWGVNTRLSRGAFKLALLWRMGGREGHRRRAEEILTGYARRYASYVCRRPGTRGLGRCCYHSLDESVWLIPLAQAYDLIRGTLTARARRRIEEGLLIPAAGHIVTQRFNQIHNIECWHNAAVGTVGVCLDRPDLVRLAVDSRYGFRGQLREGVRPDGFWFEGSTSYHFYTLAALITLAAATEETGLALHRTERLRRMFEAPVEYAYPDLSMPAMNDCWYFTTLLGETCHNTPDAAGFYEVGRAWYGEAFAWVLEENYRRRKRDSLEALLYGRQTSNVKRQTSNVKRTSPTPVPPPSPYTEREGASRAFPLCLGEGEVVSRFTFHASRLFPDSGYAVLRAGAPETYLLLKYGPHGGGHGHPDKLSLILHACGAPVSPDLGTPGYGIALNQTWYRRTVSHNTVVIDGLSQPPGEGRLNRFDGSGEQGFLSADASVAWEEGSYKGVRMRRVVLVKADLTHPLPPPSPYTEREGATRASPPGRGRVRSALYFIDLFAVTCDRQRQIDWVFRVKGALRNRRRGEAGNLPLREGGLGEGEGYEHIARVRAGRARDRARLSWRVGKGGVDLFLVGDSEVFVGDAPFNPASERTDVVVVRRRAKATVFASVFCVHEGRPFVRGVRAVAKGPGLRGAMGLVVETEEGEETWVISLQNENCKLQIAN